jgi:hypothetical protein
MNTMNTTARLVALHRAMRAGKIDRAYRLAAKVGIPTLATRPETVWRIAVMRLTGDTCGYELADGLASQPR